MDLGKPKFWSTTLTTLLKLEKPSYNPDNGTNTTEEKLETFVNLNNFSNWPYKTTASLKISKDVF